jgi:hypothetical protein
MESLIYFFSKFTSEFLLFEAFFIFLVISVYSAFWFLRKRKFGSLDQAVPSSLVKQYLTGLIEEAHLIRTQLFGLLNQSQGGAVLESNVQQILTQFQAKAEGAQAAISAGVAAPASPTASHDPAVAEKLAALEAKLAEQTTAMNSVVTEKERIAQELAALKLKGSSGGDAGTGANVDGLKNQIKSLEERLAEYSVIEDDLANLKRLQQENAQLKAALGGATATSPAPGSTAAQALTGAIAAAPSFEGLVDQVEQSLQAAPEAAAATAPPQSAAEALSAQVVAEAAPPAAVAPAPAPAPAPAAPAPAAADSTNAAPADTLTKNDEDLLSEFEKMLNI